MSADLLKKAQGQWRKITTPRRSSVTICLSKLLSHQSVSPLSNTFVARQLLILCSAFTVLRLYNGVNLNNKEEQLTNEPHIHFPGIIAAQPNMWYHSFIRLFSTINASESWSVLLFFKKGPFITPEKYEKLDKIVSAKYRSNFTKFETKLILQFG